MCDSDSEQDVANVCESKYVRRQATHGREGGRERAGVSDRQAYRKRGVYGEEGRC